MSFQAGWLWGLSHGNKQNETAECWKERHCITGDEERACNFSSFKQSLPRPGPPCFLEKPDTQRSGNEGEFPMMPPTWWKRLP